MLMRGKVLSAIALAVAIAVLVGCHKDNKYKFFYKAKEECILPPNGDPRFDNPPSAEYRARVKATDDKASLMGGGGKMAGGGGGGGRPGGGF